MAGRAVLFAITSPDLAAIEARAGSDEVADYIANEVEERWEEEFVFELDKGWDALHRSICGGSLEVGAGEFPLNAAILGCEVIEAGDSYFVSLTRSDQVAAVADAVATVTEDQVRSGYARIDSADYGPEYGAEDLEYTLGCFDGLLQFWRRSAESMRSVIFTVDQ